MSGGTFTNPPSTAAWQHRDARDGFEVVFIHAVDDGYCIEGATAAVEDGHPWVVEYVITLDRDWLTRSAFVQGHFASGRHELMLETDRAGLDGQRRLGARCRRLPGRRSGSVLAHQRVARPPARARSRPASRCAGGVRPRARPQRRAARAALRPKTERRQASALSVQRARDSGSRRNCCTTRPGW